MKKFVIAVTLLIPILVVISIMASSAIIVATGTPINPESMTVLDENNKDLPSIIAMDYFSGGTFLNIEVFPAIAWDKSVTFTKVKGSGDGVAEFTPVSENRYRILPITIGVAQYTVRPTANVNIYKIITIDITSESAIGNAIYNGNGDEIGNKYEITGEERLYAETIPISSLKNVGWTSSDSSVFHVDANGTIFPTGRGTATLYVSITDKSDSFVTKSIQISTNYAVAVSKAVYFANTPTDEEILAKAAVNPNDTRLEKITDCLYRLTSDIGSESYSAEVEIRSYESDFAFLDDVEEAYIGNAPAYLFAGLAGSRFSPFEGVTFTSGDSSILRLTDDGEIVPVTVGNTMVYAEYNGVTIGKAVTIKERPGFIELSLNSVDGERGIERTRVWAPYNMQSGVVTEGVELALKNQNASYDVEWSFDGLGDLSVYENGKGAHITFDEAEAGKAVTVTAVLKLGARYVKSLRQSFTFNVSENYQSINVCDFEGYKAVNENDFAQMDIVLQNDIAVTEFMRTKASLYGNGFTMDGSGLNYIYRYDTVIIYEDTFLRYESGKPKEAEYLLCKNYTIRNLHVKCHNASDFSMETLTLGECLKLYALDVPVTVKYCEMEYANMAIEANVCQNVTIEGCLFGDNYRGAFNAQTNIRENALLLEYPYEYTFRNNVFKKSTTPSVTFNTSSAQPYDKNYVPDIKLEGFMDCYNWMEKGDIGRMIGNVVGGAGASAGVDLSAVLDLLNSTINNIVDQSTISNALYTYKGKQYICPCIFMTGFLYTADFSTICNNSNLMAMPFNFVDKNGNELPILKSANMIVSKLVKGVTTLSNPSMMYTADFKSDNLTIKPDSPVPSSEELFSHLRGEI